MTVLLLVALSGLCFGSFVTLASYRLPREEDIVFKPSRCPNCDTTLEIPDLFPVLSWASARGRCRHCRVPIHWRYPAIEIATMALFLLVYQRYGIGLPALLLMGTAVALLIMIVADFEHYIIPDAVHLMLLPLGLGYAAATGRPWEVAFIGAALGLAIGLSLSYGYRALRGKEGLGLGDVKFLFVAGIWLGGVNLVPFLTLAGLIGIVTGIVWRASGKGVYFPFGPALAASLFACVVYPEAPAAFWRAGAAVHEVLLNG